MLERETRDRLADLIEQYLRGALNGAQFDDQVTEFWDSTNDSTVYEISTWLLDGDLPVPGMPAFSKEQWDFCQRILLVLRSDAELELQTTYTWSRSQFIAAIALLGFVALAIQLGLSSQLLLIAIPFGLISIALDYWRERDRPKTTTAKLSRFPFSTVGELVAVRRSVPNFRKANYTPPSLRREAVLHIEKWFLMMPQFALRMVYSPAVLFMQLFPIRSMHSKVVLPRNYSLVDSRGCHV